MHVVQATAWYPPHNLGGSEIYLQGLIGELRRVGCTSTVLVPQHRDSAENYIHEATHVETFPVNEVPIPGELKGDRVHHGFERFRERLLAHRSAIYHQHAWTRGCGAAHLKTAHELGMPTVLTVHVPGNTCLRGTMLRFGKVPCDGRVEPKVCGACWAEDRGMPKPLAQALGHLPQKIAHIARPRTGRLATMLSARELGAAMRRQIGETIDAADRVVAVCQWLHDVLSVNGVPRNKLVLCRQGVSRDDLNMLAVAKTSRLPSNGPLRLLLLARWDPVKGIDVAVRAVRALPSNTSVELRICAVPAIDGDVTYERQVRQLAGTDPRIRFDGPLPRKKLSEALATADLLVVPSIWLETGPLVVLEARAAGLFVLGSRRGGIAELVEDDDGELVEAGDVGAWSAAIARLATRHAEGNFPSPKRGVRTMAEAAREMAAVYASL